MTSPYHRGSSSSFPTSDPRFLRQELDAIEDTLRGLMGNWTNFVPVVDTLSGTITTLGAVTAQYLQVGKTVLFNANVPITANGTGGTALRITLPFPALGTAILGGKSSNSNVALTAIAAGTTMLIYKYDGTYPGVSGNTVRVSGAYQMP